jgi:hypothetical protein
MSSQERRHIVLCKRFRWNYSVAKHLSNPQYRDPNSALSGSQVSSSSLGRDNRKPPQDIYNSGTQIMPLRTPKLLFEVEQSYPYSSILNPFQSWHMSLGHFWVANRAIFQHGSHKAPYNIIMQRGCEPHQTPAIDFKRFSLCRHFFWKYLAWVPHLSPASKLNTCGNNLLSIRIDTGGRKRLREKNTTLDFVEDIVSPSSKKKAEWRAGCWNTRWIHNVHVFMGLQNKRLCNKERS